MSKHHKRRQKHDQNRNERISEAIQLLRSALIYERVRSVDGVIYQISNELHVRKREIRDRWAESYGSTPEEFYYTVSGETHTKPLRQKMGTKKVTAWEKFVLLVKEAQVDSA